MSETESSQASMLHLYRSPLVNESRIERACQLARRIFPDLQQRVVGIQNGTLPSQECKGPGIVFQRVAPPPRGGWQRGPFRTRIWDRSVADTFQGWNLAAISAHSWGVLPLAARLARGAGAALLYEPHELESHTAHTPGWLRWLARWTENRLIKRCDAVVVVSDSIADWYAKTYDIPRPVVVRNMPALPVGGVPPADRRLWRDRFEIPEDHIIFIYQGGLFPGRRIEQLILVFARAKPDRHVVFMGYGELEELVRAAAQRHPNIHFAPAVKPDEVLRHTAGADVGLVGVEKVCLSYYYSLPNKLFEYLMAGIPALMPAYPEMVRVAGTSACGWTVGERHEDWLAVVNGLDADAVTAAKRRARAAVAANSWEMEQKKLLAVYLSLPGFGSLSQQEFPV